MNSLSETMEDIVKNETGLKRHHLFPVVLHQILSEPKFHDIITWLPHGRSFKVLDRDKFIDDVAHEFFSFNKYRSFSRQLNLWGFSRISEGCDHGSYYHKYFHRGLPQLVYKIKRTLRCGKTTYIPPPPPDLDEISKVCALPAPPLFPAKIFSVNSSNDETINCDDKSKKLVEVVPSVKETKHVSALSSFNRVQDRPTSLCTASGETKMVPRGLMVINEPTSLGRVSEEMKKIHADRENTISRGLTLNDLPVNLYAASGETENILYDREHMISRGIRLRDKPLNLCRASGETKNNHVDRENTISQGLILKDLPASLCTASRETKNIFVDRENIISRGLGLKDGCTSLCRPSGETKIKHFDSGNMIARGLRPTVDQGLNSSSIDSLVRNIVYNNALINAVYHNELLRAHNQRKGLEMYGNNNIQRIPYCNRDSGHLPQHFNKKWYNYSP